MTDDALLMWLTGSALPTWSTVGTDRRRGGFFEAIDLTGHAVEAPRRTRVVARQTYVFATAARHGWLPAANGWVEHGLHFLSHRLRREDGTYAASVLADGGSADERFDLYEHAFVLFALASAHSADAAPRAALQSEAEGLLSCLRQGWGHRIAGFEESRSGELPLKSNPHMHLLEAALAWAEETTDSSALPWETLADELVHLCTTFLIDPESGAMREYFDANWQAMPSVAGAVEPGHQFEWAWLLIRWARRRRNLDVLPIARRLVEIGEAHGVDQRRGVAINALTATLAVCDDDAKLWPQTERIKAWHAMASIARNDAETAAASRHLRQATQGLARYLLDSPAGLWHERMGSDGQFVAQDCRASSLYHIVGAIDTLHTP